MNLIKASMLMFFLFSYKDSHAEPEKYYQFKNCKGEIEFVLPNRTRVDCLTKSHAIEYDFGKKWAEAIGQSLHYAMWTGRRAGIVLIVKKSETRYINRLNSTIKHYNLPIDVTILRR